MNINKLKESVKNAGELRFDVLGSIELIEKYFNAEQLTELTDRIDISDFIIKYTDDSVEGDEFEALDSALEDVFWFICCVQSK